MSPAQKKRIYRTRSLRSRIILCSDSWAYLLGLWLNTAVCDGAVGAFWRTRFGKVENVIFAEGASTQCGYLLRCADDFRRVCGCSRSRVCATAIIRFHTICSFLDCQIFAAGPKADYSESGPEGARASASGGEQKFTQIIGGPLRQ